MQLLIVGCYAAIFNHVSTASGNGLRHIARRTKGKRGSEVWRHVVHATQQRWCLQRGTPPFRSAFLLGEGLRHVVRGAERKSGDDIRWHVVAVTQQRYACTFHAAGDHERDGEDARRCTNLILLTACTALPKCHGSGIINGGFRQSFLHQISNSNHMQAGMEVESARWEPANADPPPPKPEHFDGRYVLPAHRIKLLEKKHPHPRDDRIVFYEEPHIYTVDDYPVQASVSGLPHEYEREFDPAEGILAMKRSRRERWPKLAYVRNAQRVEHAHQLHGPSLLVDAESGLTVAAIQNPGDADGEAILSALKGSAVRVPSTAHMYVFERTLTDSEITQMWDANGEDARNRGTEAHLQMELWFNSEPVRLDEGEVKVGLNFVQKCLLPIGAKGFRTEWTIFGEEENVAGCIDLAAILPSGDIYLVDWKRSEKLALKMYGYKPMKEPMTHLEDCSGCAYALQLSCYQYILEKYYGMRVVGRALASIHPDKPFTTSTPYLKEEVEFLMNRRKAMTTARDALSADPCGAPFLCSISGRFVMTAVRDVATGALYEEKVAKLHDKDVLADKTTTDDATRLLNERMPPVTLPANLVKWKTRFPRPTDDLLFFS